MICPLDQKKNPRQFWVENEEKLFAVVALYSVLSNLSVIDIEIKQNLKSFSPKVLQMQSVENLRRSSKLEKLMMLFTCGFIHLQAEDCLHMNQSLKKRAKFCLKNFLMKIKVSKLVKVGYIDGKTFYGIGRLIVDCEKLSVDEVEAMLYCDELADTILHRGYCMDQIFIADGTGFSYKMLPSKTLVVKAEKEAPGAI